VKPPKLKKKRDRPGVETALLRLFKEIGVPRQEYEDAGLDIGNTPARIVKMYRDELLSSYKPGAYEALVKRFTCFDSDGQDAMVTIGPIDFNSLCAHHMLPFTGCAYVGYLPKAKLIGASKIPRVVDFYAAMLQIQERLSRQVADFIVEHATPRAVLVLMTAKHQCMQCRGVKKQSAALISTAIRPTDVYEDNRGVVDEFYKQISLLDQKYGR
jgi:GTP cyclohydrolase I